MADFTPPLELKPDQIRQWWDRIELARAKRKPKLAEAKKLLQAYQPPASDSETVNTNVHFRNTELKKAQMFFQVPEIQATPMPGLVGAIDPTTQQPIDPYAAVAAKREALNVLLGRRHTNVMRAIDQTLFDVLQVGGAGCCEIHYVCEQPLIEADMPTGEIQPQPGAVLGLGAQTPVTEPQQVPGPPVNERWEWEYFSYAKFLKPHDWASTDFDRSPWLGREFAVSLAEAKRRKWVSPDFTSNATTDKRELSLDADTDRGTTELVTGVKVWLRASEFDETVIHSQQMRLLILIDGQKDRPGEYRESPYQDLVPGGALGPHSMLGNPIHPLTLRDLTESSDPSPDAAFTAPLVKQKNTKRSQDIKLRDANLPRFMHAESITEAVDKLQRADVGQGAGIPDELIRTFGTNLILPLPKLEHAQSDRELETAIDRDLEETLGIGSNQAGTVTDSVRSATEVATVQQNVTVRMRKERTRALDWFLLGLEKYDSLVVRYGDQNNLAPLVGPQAAQLLLAFKTINGKALFDAKADSQLSLDANDQRENVMKYVNFMAKSQYVDQAEMARLVTTDFGYDASRLVKEPQPQGPPPPNVSVKVDIADLAGPAGAAALKILQQAGYQLTTDDLSLAQANGLIVAQQEAAQQAAKTAHGGAADQAEKVSKHHSELTGNMDGRAPQGVPAAPAPMAGAH